MNAVSRLLKQLEQLKQSWLECQQHVRHKIVLSTIELIESWTEVGFVNQSVVLPPYILETTLEQSVWRVCLCFSTMTSEPSDVWPGYLAHWFTLCVSSLMVRITKEMLLVFVCLSSC